MRYTKHVIMRICLLALLGGNSSAGAQVQSLILGRGGVPWLDVAQRIIALEDTTHPGALQPRRIDPNQNFMVGPRNERGDFTYALGYAWAFNKVGRGENFELGVNPRFWTSIRVCRGCGGHTALIDGDPQSVTKVIGVSKGSPGQEHLHTFDFGVPMPINRVVFFPPEKGVDELGGLMKQRFPRAYEVSAALEPRSYLLLGEETSYHTLDKVLARTFSNDSRVVDLRFPTQILRFLRISFNLVDQQYLLSEIQVYGEGAPPVTSYRTVLLDMERPVNFGRIKWTFSRHRQGDSGTEPDSDAPVDLVLETRSGKDHSPHRYYLVSDFGSEDEVDEATYRRAAESSIRIGPRPGDQSSIKPDEENWSFWSVPYSQSGEQVRSPDARRFLQLQFRMESSDFLAFGRLDSIAVEYSPLLVEKLVGEVGLAGAASGSAAVEVPAGVDTTFLSEIRAHFGPAGRSGFDVLRLQTPGGARFVRFEIGDPPQAVEPDSVVQTDDLLVVYFPTNKIRRTSGSERVRLSFNARLLRLSTPFNMEIAALNDENLPQSVEPGDASAELGSNDIWIFARDARLKTLNHFEVSPRALTPNADGVNDAVTVELLLLGVEGARVRLGVHALGGRRVRRLADVELDSGPFVVQWDGSDDDGGRVAPGLYLVKVQIVTQGATIARARPISVVY